VVASSEREVPGGGVELTGPRERILWKRGEWPSREKRQKILYLLHANSV